MLKEILREKNMNLSILSKRTGISKGHLSKIANLKINNVTVQVILKISKELNVCPVKFFLFFAGLDCKFHDKCCKRFKCIKSITIMEDHEN